MIDRVLIFVARLANGSLVSLSNPTCDWPSRTVSRLEYDLASRRLSGIEVEGPLASARGLGKADWFSGGTDEPDLDYRALGLQVQCEEGFITCFRAIVHPPSRHEARDQSFRPAQVTLRDVNGTCFHLSERTEEHDLIAFLGDPIETAPVDGDRVHTFAVDGTLIESHHDATTGRLVEITFGPIRDAARRRSEAA